MLSQARYIITRILRISISLPFRNRLDCSTNCDDMEVHDFLRDKRFHQIFTLPPNLETGRTKPYQVSYADFGTWNSNAVVLICGALMGGRLAYTTLDQLVSTSNMHCKCIMRNSVVEIQSDPLERTLLTRSDLQAKKHRVRIIHPDRPGIGATDPVPVGDRIAMWLGQ